mmetsp:Transcript_8375/g.29774  ORF Transcript_8375/g.29774 Transcript_8375/m.29774 type:complete len:447 (+) Transcript_8375:208-1548(+)
MRRREWPTSLSMRASSAWRAARSSAAITWSHDICLFFRLPPPPPPPAAAVGPALARRLPRLLPAAAPPGPPASRKSCSSTDPPPAAAACIAAKKSVGATADDVDRAESAAATAADSSPDDESPRASPLSASRAPDPALAAARLASSAAHAARIGTGSPGRVGAKLRRGAASATSPPVAARAGRRAPAGAVSARAGSASYPCGGDAAGCPLPPPRALAAEASARALGPTAAAAVNGRPSSAGPASAASSSSAAASSPRPRRSSVRGTWRGSCVRFSANAGTGRPIGRTACGGMSGTGRPSICLRRCSCSSCIRPRCQSCLASTVSKMAASVAVRWRLNSASGTVRNSVSVSVTTVKSLSWSSSTHFSPKHSPVPTTPSTSGACPRIGLGTKMLHEPLRTIDSPVSFSPLLATTVPRGAVHSWMPYVSRTSASGSNPANSGRLLMNRW